MPTLKDIQDKAIGQVNGLTTALKFTKDDFFVDGPITDSASVEVNPIDVLMALFKSIKGYDWLIEAVSHFIAFILPGLEWSVKSILLVNLKAMTTCSINPIITSRIIKNGAVFDINKIDLLNMFAYSPLDRRPLALNSKARKNYYYFGCEPEDGINYIDDLKDSRDFNAVLWYAKNTPNERVLWRRKKDLEKPLALTKRDIGGNISWYKQPKSNGIVTIEYNQDSQSLVNSEAFAMNVQEPINNCVHVFIGCNVPLTTDIPNHDALKTSISQNTKEISKYDQTVDNLTAIKEQIKNEYNRRSEEIKSNGDSNQQGSLTSANGLYREYRREINLIDKIIRKIKHTSSSSTLAQELNNEATYTFDLAGPNGITITIDPDLMATSRKKEIHDKKESMLLIGNPTTSNYPSAKSNYYYLHTLVEFNTDFVLSMDPLFDAKVVTAQLIDALTGLITYGSEFGGTLKLSLQSQFIQGQIRELVEKVISRGTGTVNDCFFSFTNDSYNAMLQQVELNRAGLYTYDGVNSQNIPSADDVFDSLNNLSQDATKEEVQTAISDALFKAVSSATPHGPGEFSLDGSLEFSANGNILSSLLMKLVYVIVTVIISPKIYILLMLNMHIMGQDAEFDLQKFIMQFKNMIVELIQKIRDYILDWFIAELNKLLSDIAKQLAVKLALEQYQYYINLLNSCIMCLKLHRNQYDWAMDDVDYADITSLTEYANEEC